MATFSLNTCCDQNDHKRRVRDFPFAVQLLLSKVKMLKLDGILEISCFIYYNYYFFLEFASKERDVASSPIVKWSHFRLLAP